MMNAWQRKSLMDRKVGYGCNGRNGHVTQCVDVVWCGAVVIVIVVHGIHVTQLHSQLPL